LVDRMLAKDPAQRYPTPARAAQALQAFLASHEEEGTVPDVDARMKSYLQWLEKDSATAATARKAVPDGATERTPEPAADPFDFSDVVDTPRPGKSRVTPRPRLPGQVRPEPTGAAETADVELVAVNETQPCRATGRQAFRL